MSARRLPWGRMLGELVVIVVGVLVALWIEGAREDRADLQLEHQYLVRLEADLVADSARMSGHRAGRERARTAALAAIDFVQNGWSPERDTVALLQTLNYAGFISFLRLRSTTWDDLRSTGNLRLMSDQGLRQQFGDYYASTFFLDEFDDQMKQAVWFDYRPRMDLHLDGALVAALMDRGQISPGPDAKLDFNGFRQDEQIRVALASTVGAASVVLRQLEPIERANKELLAMLRARLR